VRLPPAVVVEDIEIGDPRHEMTMLPALYRAGKLIEPLEQINDGYRDMLDGKNIRGVIRYTDADR